MKAKYRVLLGLCGNEKVVKAFVDFYEKNSSARLTYFRRKQKTNSWQTASGRLETLEFMLDLLYNTGGPSLSRKKEKAQEAIRIAQEWKRAGGKSDPLNKRWKEDPHLLRE